MVRDGRDFGIDLVGVTKDGGYVAIQCKCKDESSSISPSDLGTFVSDAAPTRSTGFRFESLMLVCTCGISKATATMLKERDGLWINLLFRHRHEPLHLKDIKKPYAPRPMQREAIESCIKGFSRRDNRGRGRLIMACGTGKTFTALKIAEGITPQPKRILFIAPSISLIGQARREWIRQSAHNLDCLIVCSDATAGRTSRDDSLELLLLDSPVTRSPKVIADFLAADTGSTRAVFCTYHSLEKVSAAQKKHQAAAFDLTLIDEAHRTTGVEKPASAKKSDWSFQDVHQDSNIRTARRLYMTATPRIYTTASKKRMQDQGVQVYDMSDESVYGPEFYHLKFRDAVDWRGENGERMLCDYRVITLFVPKNVFTDRMRKNFEAIANDRRLTANLNFKFIRHCMRIYGTALALNGEIVASRDSDLPPALHRAIGFCNTVRNSNFYAKALGDRELKKKITKAIPGTAKKINAEHLDAGKDAITRTRALMRLQNAVDDDSCEILSNVSLFKEGVDVPSLDAVIFFEPRKSQVDVVQAVGRVMRHAKDKKYGYIIIPIEMPDSSNLKDILKNEEGFKAIGQALRALQSHDERLRESIAQMVIPAVIPPLDDTDDAQPDTAAERQAKYSQTQLDLGTELGRINDDILTQVLDRSGLGSAGRINADEIEYTVKGAADILTKTGAAEDIARVIGDDSHLHTSDKARAKRLKAICIIGSLLLMNAMLLHKRMASGGNVKNLVGLNNFGSQADPLRHLQKEWLAILATDYKPIFEPALAVLQALPFDLPESKQATRRLAECANNVADSLSELGYDHAGPLYHRILGTAESDGAFYTTNNAALLLAQLALSDNFINWKKKATVKNLRIIDPACGTGTLLMAALKTIKEQVLQENAAPAVHSALHKSLVENSIYGLDINLQAIQIAASNLTLRAPEVDYHRINLYAMQHGIQTNGEARAGSLELLRDRNLPLFTRSCNIALGKDMGQHVNSKQESLPLLPNDLDMVIMNPPYSNNTKRSAKLGKKAKALMQKNERGIKAAVASAMGKDAADVIDFNSIATFFTPFVESLLNKQNGTLAMVMPATGCVNPSSVNMRRYIAARFHIERLVVSHAQGNYNFSGNTDISECLLIARRKPQPHLPTEIVVLHKMPQSASDVYTLHDAIKQQKLGSWGTCHKWQADKMQQGDWSPVQWFDSRLVQAVQSIKSQSGLIRLDENHAIAASGQSIRASFKRCDTAVKGTAALFYSRSAELRNTIHAKASEYAKPKAGKERDAERLLDKGGHFLLATRVNTQSGLVTGIYSPTAAIGSGWVPVTTKDQDTAKALAVWWNSTLVWLQLLNTRGMTMTWPMWSIKDLHRVLVPPMTDKNIATLLKAYEQTKTVQLCRMKDSADDPTRKLIDAATAKVSGISLAKINEWRTILSQEPTINPR